MAESEAESDREKLRAFEKKMHDEGAAGFADGPSPWETWDDESDPRANNRVWEGKSKRIYPKQQQQPSLGDRVLSGLAMLSLATMVVGIAGVYFSDPQPRQVAARDTGVQPLPIEHTPRAADSVIATLEQLPNPTAGDIAAGNDRDDPALSAPATRSGMETGAAAIEAAASNSTVQAPALPGTAPASPVTDATDRTDNLAKQPASAGDSLTTTADTTSVGTAAERITGSDISIVPAPAALDTDIEPVSSPEVVTTTPVTVTVTVTAGTAASVSSEVHTATAADTAAANDLDAATAVTEPETATGSLAIVTALETVPDAAATSTAQPPLHAPLAAPATAPEPDTGAGSGRVPAVVAPFEAITEDAAAGTATTETAPDVADAVAAIEALPVPMAGSVDAVEDVPADSTAMPPMAATHTAIAIADQDDRTAATAPAEAAEEIEATGTPGDWVVNLASYTRESTANRMLAEFRNKGVDAELVTVMINDRPMHRIRVAGFNSSQAAKTSIDPLEQQLGLEGVWISRK